jgi:hypothetical protein
MFGSARLSTALARVAAGCGICSARLMPPACAFCQVSQWVYCLSTPLFKPSTRPAKLSTRLTKPSTRPAKPSMAFFCRTSGLKPASTPFFHKSGSPFSASAPFTISSSQAVSALLPVSSASTDLVCIATPASCTSGTLYFLQPNRFRHYQWLPEHQRMLLQFRTIRFSRQRLSSAVPATPLYFQRG